MYCSTYGTHIHIFAKVTCFYNMYTYSQCMHVYTRICSACSLTCTDAYTRNCKRCIFCTMYTYSQCMHIFTHICSTRILTYNRRVFTYLQSIHVFTICKRIRNVYTNLQHTYLQHMHLQYMYKFAIYLQYAYM